MGCETLIFLNHYEMKVSTLAREAGYGSIGIIID